MGSQNYRRSIETQNKNKKRSKEYIMEVIGIIVPVFFVLLMGMAARKKGWLSEEQKDGVKQLVFSILFPFMIFNALFTCSFEASMGFIVLYMICFYIAGFIIGKVTGRFVGKNYAHLSKYLFCTNEGGNLCYPLYITIVGSQYIGNAVVLDLACMLVVFILIPILVSRDKEDQADVKTLVISTAKNPLVIVVMAGLILNLIGGYHILKNSPFFIVYDKTISLLTGPIALLILLILGYEFKIGKDNLMPVIKTVIMRVIIMAVGAGLFLHIFKSQTSDLNMMIAVLLYFSCSPSLAMAIELSPLCRNENDNGYISAFFSLYMLLTMIAYIMIVVFIA